MSGLHRTHMVFVATDLKMARAIVPFSTVAPLKRGAAVYYMTPEMNL